jgi:hypothetical protein
MKEIIRRYFPAAPRVYHAVRDVVTGRRKRPGMRAVFSSIHQSNAWLGAESVSGLGSDSVNTATVKRELPGLLRALGARTMLDAPCGDLNWIKDIDLGLDRYIGADVVPDVIRRNRELYQGASREFRVLDITKGRVPKVDVILCRDCLVHLSHRHAAAALRAFQKSGSRYLLTTTFTGPRENTDIQTGEWRPLNLERPPFSLPAPVRVLNEGYVGEDGQFADKSLGLWELQGLDIAALTKLL